MRLGRDDIIIVRGSSYNANWTYQNEDTDENEDFAGLTATCKIKNIDEEFEDVANTFVVGTVVVEPEDINHNIFKGRINLSLSKEDTLKLKIPQSEEDRYGESGVYAILTITLSTGEVILYAKVTVLESIESEDYDYVEDNVIEVLERLEALESIATVTTGTYTPTFTNKSAFAQNGIAIEPFIYTKIGNIVSVKGALTISDIPATYYANVVSELSLPIEPSSNFTVSKAIGSVSLMNNLRQNLGIGGVHIKADTKKIELDYNVWLPDLLSLTAYVDFTYKI